MTVRVEATADSRFGTNSYLVWDEESKQAVVIDANLEPDAMVDLVAERGVSVLAILLTHTDVDHVAGLPRLREAFGDIPIAVHDAERAVVTSGESLRGRMGAGLLELANVDALVPGEAYSAGPFTFGIRHTPGHSPGGVSLVLGNAVFTGDALFAGSIGRSDFGNSDGAALLAGIHQQLLTLPDDTVVLSGHGPSTTIGRERQLNPFLT